jgi:hypothetical protein
VAKTLIAEADVSRFAPDRPIVLDADMLITPSALDKASRLRIPVIRAGESRPVAPSCACASLADGTYLVTVSQGRKEWFELPPSGGGPRPMERR